MDYSRLIYLIAKEFKIGSVFKKKKSNVSSGYLTVIERLKNSQHVFQVTRHKTVFRLCTIVQIKGWMLL